MKEFIELCFLSYRTEGQIEEEETIGGMKCTLEVKATEHLMASGGDRSTERNIGKVSPKAAVMVVSVSLLA